MPQRTPAGYRVYGLPRAEPAAVAPAAPRARSASTSTRWRSPPGSAASPSCARPSTPGSRPPTTVAPGSSGSSASTSGSSPPERPELRLPRRPTTRGFMATTKTTRREGPGARARGRAAHHVGRPADAGAGRDPRAVRGRAAARRLPHRRVPARDHRDGQPDAHAEGRRRRRRAVRVEPALDPGRRRRGARRGVRHLGLRDQGRGQRHLLPAHRGRGRPQAAADDGRRRRRDRRPPHAPAASSSATSSPAWRRPRPA